MASDEEHRLQIRQAQLARLQELELTEARYGADTKPEIKIEARQIRSALEPIEIAVANPIKAQAAEDIGAGGRWVATDTKLNWIVDLFKDGMKDVKEWQQHFEQQWQQQFEQWSLLIILAVVVSVGAVTISLVFAALVIARLW